MVGGKLLMRKRKTPDLRRDQIRGLGGTEGDSWADKLFFGLALCEWR